MNKMMKYFALACAMMTLLPAAVLAATTNATAKSDPLFSDSVVARGKGIEIKRSALDGEIISARALYATRGMPVPADLDKQALRGLVVKGLILSHATAD